MGNLKMALDACPFCGPEVCDPKMRVDTEEWEIARVACDNCQALGPFVELSLFENIEDAEYEAASRWNERA